MALADIPTFVGSVDQTFLVERLGGSQHPYSLLDRFPEEAYNKAPETHLVKFLYALLGPAGTGQLRLNYFLARLALEDHGLELFNLDAFYGNPLQFGRIFDEFYAEDPTGLLPKDKWEEIRAKDERYRSRAIDFMNGARAGNTPFGLRLVARSGLGHDVEIIENYKYLFDSHSDEPVGVPYFGRTQSLEEFIVLPRREISRSEVQTITVTGIPTSGNFQLSFNGEFTQAISFDAPGATTDTDDGVQEALEALTGIGLGNVRVTGGPGPLNPWVVTFTGTLAGRDLPELEAVATLFGGTTPTISVTTMQGGIESVDEAVNIPARDGYHLQQALDRLRPITTVPTTASASGLRSRQIWNTAFASSEYHELIRYVTGSSRVKWPEDAQHWIRQGVEKEAPRVHQDLNFHYQGFHNLAGIKAYTDAALAQPNYLSDLAVLDSFKSEHVGPFSPAQQKINFHLVGVDEDNTPDKALADYTEPLLVTKTTEPITPNALPTQMINGVYPLDYGQLVGVPEIRYINEQMWASLERTGGADYLELDLGSSRAVNYVSFEVSKKPIDMEVNYDLLNLSPRRKWQAVSPQGPNYPSGVVYRSDDLTSWQYCEFNFTDAIGNIPITRYLRIKFLRRLSSIQPYLFDLVRGVQNPWSIEVRNLRIGRNIS